MRRVLDSSIFDASHDARPRHDRAEVTSHLSRASAEESSDGPFRPHPGEGLAAEMDVATSFDLLGRPSPEHRCGLCSTSPKLRLGEVTLGLRIAEFNYRSLLRWHR